MSYRDQDLLPIAALQHFCFCPRQWALIHLEQQWQDNLLTSQGHILHERVHEAQEESGPDLRVSRGLKLLSRRLGLYGVADVVEFQRGFAGQSPYYPCPSNDSSRSDREDRWQYWRIFPVEYKRGRPKVHRADHWQLCAQGLCLEEMLNTPVLQGAIFYGQPRRREVVCLDERLRAEVNKGLEEMRCMWELGQTPPAQAGSSCRACSMSSLCLPKASAKSALRYLRRNLTQLAEQ
ncbi:MAG: CRISPR-associated protein Cas4 [Desulfarculales bacterium]|jgi:CRISPR-associated exonuclease Cas4|nr:CRISPR-associated protein Cas4 [Desulfarculales bacterium]